MVLCLLSRDSHGDTGKLNHEETVRGSEIAISPGKSEILLLILVKILKKSDSTRGGKRAQKTPNIPKSWGADRDAFSSTMGRPSGQYLSDLRYVDGSARFGEQQKGREQQEQPFEWG